MMSPGKGVPGCPAVAPDVCAGSPSRVELAVIAAINKAAAATKKIKELFTFISHVVSSPGRLVVPWIVNQAQALVQTMAGVAWCEILEKTRQQLHSRLNLRDGGGTVGQADERCRRLVNVVMLPVADHDPGTVGCSCERGGIRTLG